jgi:hypothetical protein
MPRHASFQDVRAQILPIIVDVGNPNYDPGVPHLQLYEYWNIGRFLWFRFDERNWIPKKALTQYNREWPHHQLGLHQATEARRVFFRVRDTTQQNFFQGLADVVNTWLSETRSGENYRVQYGNRRHANPPPVLPIDIATTRYPRGPGRVPN